jgi:hypothetical protein
MRPREVAGEMGAFGVEVEDAEQSAGPLWGRSVRSVRVPDLARGGAVRPVGATCSLVR